MLFYHNTNNPEHTVPKNLPTVDFDDKLTGEGWVKVPVGAQVKTHYQAYRFGFPKPGWYISAYFTSEKYVNSGLANYRKPSSLRAWATVLSQLPRKYIRKWRGDL